MVDKKEKVIAELFSKIVNGDCVEEEVISLLDYLIAQSSCFAMIKKKPGIAFFVGGEKVYGDKVLAGRYKTQEKNIYLSGNLLSTIGDKGNNVLPSLINTLGHELTHHVQQERGFRFPCECSGESVEAICSVLGIKGLVKKDCDLIAFSRYLQLVHEEQARENAILFSEEVLKMIKKNKYLNSEDKKTLVRAFQESVVNNRNKEKDNKAVYVLYKSFCKKIASFDIEYFCELSQKIKRGEVSASIKDLGNAISMKIDGSNPKDVCKDYIRMLLSDEPEVILSLQEGILGENFPKKMRESLKKELVRSLSQKGVNNKVYSVELSSFLDSNQIGEIYGNLLMRDFVKVKSNLFRFFLMYSEQGASIIGEKIIEFFKENGLGGVSADCLKILREDIELIFLNKNISSRLKEKLNNIVSNVINPVVKGRR